MNGMEMFLITALKTMLPKEAAEKIVEYATDGTIERFAAIPAELAEIKKTLAVQGEAIRELRAKFIGDPGCGLAEFTPCGNSSDPRRGLTEATRSFSD